MRNALTRIADGLWSALSWTLGLVVPKDPRLFVFGGRQYGGNTAPVFERCGEVGLRGAWLTRDPRILASGRPGVVAARSLRGVWLGARAGGVVLTHSLGDFAPVRFPSRRTRVLNLWHGMPIKRIGRADPAFLARRHARSNLREMRRYEAMFATSAAMARIFAETFDLPVERVHRTGQPRTDALFRPSPVNLDAAYRPPLPPHTRRILYCPTWREGRPVRLFPFPDADRGALQRFLEAHEAVMFVRTHPNDPGRLEARDGRLVPMQGDVVPEITDALPLFDVLVTDYSSVYYDFLLLDRPTVFVPYDLDDYARAPGFYLPFERIAVEPWAATQAELLAALDRALTDPAAEAAARAEVRRLVYDHADDGATARVLRVLAAPPPRR